MNLVTRSGQFTGLKFSVVALNCYGERDFTVKTGMFWTGGN
jgi:hypothetical protein